MTSNNDFPNEFWEKLKNLYEKLDNASIEWGQENESVRNIIRNIKNEIREQYDVIEPLGVGGVGVVLKIYYKNLEVFRALKFSRPIPEKESLFAKIIAGEISSLRQAINPNIIEIYSQASVTFGGENYPYYIMEYIPGAMDAFDFFKLEIRKEEVLFSIIKQVLEGIKHLHTLNILHGDVKLENILISSDNNAVISDLGSARNISAKDDKTIIIFTRPYAHPDLKAIATQTKTPDPNRIRGEVERLKLKKIFDLFALGKNLLRLLKIYDQKGWKSLSSYTHKYLELMGCRLLDGKNEEGELPFGLPKQAFHEIKYNDISEVLSDIKKLTGEYPIHNIIPELDENGIQTIQTSSLSPTPFTSRLSNTISQSLITRLMGISQLGLINLLYPTSTHARYEHVLGVYSNVIRYCNSLINDPINPLFKQIMNEEDIKSLLLAALCHDIGHFPLAHDLEEADNEVFSHKKVTIGLLEGKYDSSESRSLVETIAEEWNINPIRVANIINANPKKVKDFSLKNRILHTIIDGPIDADKLDYLVRDSLNLSLPFGKAIDFDRLLRCLTIIFKSHDKMVFASLGIHEKGKIPAETVAFARYAMFGTVYWHHTSRSAKAMLHRAVWESLIDEDGSIKEGKVIKKKRAVRKAYSDEFIQFILNLDVKGQLSIKFPKETIDIAMLTQVLPTDRIVLDWFSEKSSHAGSELINMVIRRSLFKRILVISQSKNSELWNKIKKFRSDWEDVVSLQKAIEARIIHEIQAIDDTRRRTTSVLADEAIEELTELSSKGTILVLVDIPKERPGSDIKLEYLPETERREMVEEWKNPTGLEDSVIWTKLHDHFLESVGKIRIFCHPKIRDTVKAGIKQSELEKIVYESLEAL